jgi:hypothetical protein
MGCAKRSVGLLPPSPPAEKATAREDQSRQSSTDDRAWNSRWCAEPLGNVISENRLFDHNFATLWSSNLLTVVTRSRRVLCQLRAKKATKALMFNRNRELIHKNLSCASSQAVQRLRLCARCDIDDPRTSTKEIRMPRKRATTQNENRKVTRTYVRLNADERRKIDTWGFERHIPDRSAKLRALIFKGLAPDSAGRASR